MNLAAAIIALNMSREEGVIESGDTRPKAQQDAVPAKRGDLGTRDRTGRGFQLEFFVRLCCHSARNTIAETCRLCNYYLHLPTGVMGVYGELGDQLPRLVPDAERFGHFVEFHFHANREVVLVREDGFFDLFDQLLGGVGLPAPLDLLKVPQDVIQLVQAQTSADAVFGTDFRFGWSLLIHWVMIPHAETARESPFCCDALTPVWD